VIKEYIGEIERNISARAVSTKLNTEANSQRMLSREQKRMKIQNM